MPEIRTENLTVTYYDKRESVVALDDVTVEFASGKFNVIVGSSGCGKTTLLKTIAGLIRPYEGSIYFDNTNADYISMQDRNISYVSQNYALIPHKTIYDNIAFPLKILGAPKREIDMRVKELAMQLDLTACLTRKPKHISGGQQQRTALARALVKRPSICLMDEPLSNLDPTLRTSARELIKCVFKDYGMTVIYVTHDFREAQIMADNLIVMDNGKVEIAGSPKYVVASGNPTVQGLLASSVSYFERSDHEKEA